MFFSFLNIGFSFATFKAFVKNPQKIDSAETGFAKMSAPSFKNLPQSLSTQALEILMSFMIFKTFLSIVTTKQKTVSIVKLE